MEKIITELTSMETEKAYAIIEKHMLEWVPQTSFEEFLVSLQKKENLKPIEKLKHPDNTTSVEYSKAYWPKRQKQIAEIEQDKNLVKSYLIKTYGLEDKILRYVNHNITLSGKIYPNKSNNHCYKKMLQECFPEQADLIFNFMPEVKPLKNELIAEQAEKLTFPEDFQEKQATQSALKDAFIKFHTIPDTSITDPQIFTKRLGKFYFNVGKIVTDKESALQFITMNFSHIMQPPEIFLPGKKRIPCPNKNDIAHAILLATAPTQTASLIKSANEKKQKLIKLTETQIVAQQREILLIENYKQMAAAYRGEDLIEDKATIQTEKVSVNDNVKNFGLLNKTRAQKLDDMVKEMGFDRTIDLLFKMKLTGQSAVALCQHEEKGLQILSPEEYQQAKEKPAPGS